MPIQETLSRWTTPETRSRRILVAAAVYVVCCVTFAIVAGPQRIGAHTDANHYALLADAWVHGRQDLARGAPDYTMNNDFAVYGGKTFISFPPFPALLMTPFVALAGTPENFRDGQFVIWLAGLAPAFLFLALERLRRPNARGEVWSNRNEKENVALALLFAFASVYFFTAVQGTVWFAAHVVGASLLSLYILFAIDAERPLLCGLLVACAYATRPPMLLTSALFALEALRAATRGGLPVDGTPLERIRTTWERLDKGRLVRDYVIFALPILGVFAIMGALNHARFDTWNPNVGHEYLTVAWATRMKKWGLFGYHYLAKNLGVMLTILPFRPPHDAESLGGAPFKVNEHGLALWFTTPIYFWLFWPKRRGWLWSIVAITAALPAIMDLLYQNSGWRQYSYRFSNDYAPLLFVMLALGDRAMGWFFRTAAAWSLGWQLFGAITFDRRNELDRFYFRDGSQEVLYQRDT
jgi:hypothetical protein